MKYETQKQTIKRLVRQLNLTLSCKTFLDLRIQEAIASPHQAERILSKALIESRKCNDLLIEGFAQHNRRKAIPVTIAAPLPLSPSERRRKARKTNGAKAKALAELPF